MLCLHYYYFFLPLSTSQLQKPNIIHITANIQVNCLNRFTETHMGDLKKMCKFAQDQMMNTQLSNVFFLYVLLLLLFLAQFRITCLHNVKPVNFLNSQKPQSTLFMLVCKFFLFSLFLSLSLFASVFFYNNPISYQFYLVREWKWNAFSGKNLKIVIHLKVYLWYVL